MTEHIDPTVCLTRKEAAKRLNVSTRTLQLLAKRGEGPPTARIGRKVAYPAAALADWIASKTRAA
jgi:excisionase family DNA binding protein